MLKVTELKTILKIFTKLSYKSYKAGKLTRHGAQGFQKEWSPQKPCEKIKHSDYLSDILNQGNYVIASVQTK